MAHSLQHKKDKLFQTPDSQHKKHHKPDNYCFLLDYMYQKHTQHKQNPKASDLLHSQYKQFQ